MWLGWFFYDGEGVPSVDWFVSAAEQYLERAFARFVRRGRRPLCDRQLPLFALPVVGTGNSGAKPIAGSVVSALLLMLTRFAADHPVDVCLVTKSARMLSAAQSVRLRLSPLSGLTATSHGRALGPRLLSAAERLAELAMSGQLVLFLGSGLSRTNNMPGWSELLGELAVLANLTHVEISQLGQLELKDQAFVLQHRLGTAALREREAFRAGRGGGRRLGEDTVQRVGRAALQRLAVERLTTDRYSLSHALLSTIPHSATVTTNSDLCYDAACAAAGERVVILPYESTLPGSDFPGRWLLKLHGDVTHPEDIILTYSSSNPYGYEREALSGIVQALLITKHMCFIGFSLTDDAFNQITATVRRALQPAAAAGGTIATSRTSSASSAASSSSPPSAASPSSSSSSTTTSSSTRLKTFGSALTLSDRPFMAELWPELEAVPMGEGPAEGDADRAARQRRLEVLLDRVSLLTTDTSSHLLDPAFAGAFTFADLELKTEIGALVDALRADPLLARSEAYEEIRNMLTKLGLPEDITTIDQLVNVAGQQRW